MSWLTWGSPSSCPRQPLPGTQWAWVRRCTWHPRCGQYVLACLIGPCVTTVLQGAPNRPSQTSVFTAAYPYRQGPGQDEQRVVYTTSVDLYSAGVVACELAAQHLLVEVDGGPPAPVHPHKEYATAGPLITDGLAALRALPGGLAAGS